MLDPARWWSGWRWRNVRVLGVLLRWYSVDLRAGRCAEILVCQGPAPLSMPLVDMFLSCGLDFFRMMLFVELVRGEALSYVNINGALGLRFTFRRAGFSLRLGCCCRYRLPSLSGRFWAPLVQRFFASLRDLSKIVTL